MKRLGLAVLISICCVAGYTLGAMMLFGFVFPDNDRVAYVLEIPLILPAFLLEYLIPSQSEDIFYTMQILLNVALYSVPIYGILTLISRRMRSNTAGHTDPPLPPSFDS